MKKATTFFAVLIAILMPFVILMGAVKALTSFNYPGWQYTLIGFPQDTYGYDRAERTRLSARTMEYLTTTQNIAVLMQLTDKEGKIVYTPDEVSHLQDVRRVMNTASIIWFVVLGLIAVFVIMMLITRVWTRIRNGFFWGGIFTIVLMIAMIVFMVLDFNNLFDRFHQLFFKSGTWTFSASSSLIRLFPLPLWVNAFILCGLFSLLVSVLLIIIFRPRKQAPRKDTKVVPVAIPSSKIQNIPNMATPVFTPEIPVNPSPATEPAPEPIIENVQTGTPENLRADGEILNPNLKSDGSLPEIPPAAGPASEPEKTKPFN